tara:strand:- start:378 stop:647 length:270 start_codon:yes stop_codon:yes gene_type:complete
MKKHNIFLEKAVLLEIDFIKLQDLDQCVVGLTSLSLPVYSYSKMIDHFISKWGISIKDEERVYEVIEYIDYNILPLESSKSFSILFDNE